MQHQYLGDRNGLNHLVFLILQGRILHNYYAIDKVECWSACKSFKNCQWFSYGVESHECNMYGTCNFDGNFHKPFLTGQPECKYDKVSGK